MKKKFDQCELEKFQIHLEQKLKELWGATDQSSLIVWLLIITIFGSLWMAFLTITVAKLGGF